MHDFPPQFTTVEPAETTSQIAGRLGVSNAELILANPGRSVGDHNGVAVFLDLVVGESLVIPGRVAHQFLSLPIPSRPRVPGQVQPPAGPPAMGDITLGLGPCPEGQRQLYPGVCIPDSTPKTTEKPQGPCGPGWRQLFGGVCVPEGIPTTGGGETIPALPCPVGFTQVAPGICLPAGTPVGTQRGPCGPGQIEAVPGTGLCVPTAGVPGLGSPTAVPDCSSLDPNAAPYLDKTTGEWGCATCWPSERLAADGFCYCKDGAVRQDPNDPNSPCVPANQNQPTNTQPSTRDDYVDLCRKYYGENSTAVFVDGEWKCNVCGPNEYIDSDGLCACRNGLHRQVPGDGQSPCVPDSPTQVPPGYTKLDLAQGACGSPNIWIDGAQAGCYAPPTNEGKAGEQSDSKGFPWGVVGAVTGGIALVGGLIYVAGNQRPTSSGGQGAGREAGRTDGFDRATNPVDVDKQFQVLARRWLKDTRSLSSLGEAFRHPAYREILDLGPDAVGPILRWVKAGKGGYWADALKRLAPSSPPMGREMDVEGAHQAWLAWGRARGLV